MTPPVQNLSIIKMKILKGKPYVLNVYLRNTFIGYVGTASNIRSTLQVREAICFVLASDFEQNNLITL